MNRARITVSDILLYLYAIAVLAALYPVASSLLEARSASIPAGTTIAIETVFPGLVLVLITVIYLKAGLGPQ